MNSPAEPDVRYRAAQTHDSAQDKGLPTAAPHPRWPILTLRAKPSPPNDVSKGSPLATADAVR
jgi:hypothetical protein